MTFKRYTQTLLPVIITISNYHVVNYDKLLIIVISWVIYFILIVSNY